MSTRYGDWYRTISPASAPMGPYMRLEADHVVSPETFTARKNAFERVKNVISGTSRAPFDSSAGGMHTRAPAPSYPWTAWTSKFKGSRGNNSLSSNGVFQSNTAESTSHLIHTAGLLADDDVILPRTGRKIPTSGRQLGAIGCERAAQRVAPAPAPRVTHQLGLASQTPEREWSPLSAFETPFAPFHLMPLGTSESGSHYYGEPFHPRLPVTKQATDDVSHGMVGKLDEEVPKEADRSGDLDVSEQEGTTVDHDDMSNNSSEHLTQDSPRVPHISPSANCLPLAEGPECSMGSKDCEKITVPVEIPGLSLSFLTVPIIPRRSHDGASNHSRTSSCATSESSCPNRTPEIPCRDLGQIESDGLSSDPECFGPASVYAVDNTSQSLATGVVAEESPSTGDGLRSSIRRKGALNTHLRTWIKNMPRMRF
ncbi:hypothetical protein BXZ70DRAFT_743262 [Cristinia sonorae]|uniref:Uncharacterized protein n=1 Tax=Cristinia sonorae TaxID=1940300 RepID=A0A8K0XSK9_9AGAR|nr:hypothetical protein BXZ70DRAFT_743262 [Cristinia sonorae]